MSSNLPEPPNYEEEYKLAVREAVKEIRPLVENKDKGMNTKIKNFCDKFGQQIDVVREKILSDELFSLFFIKEPAKQKFHEISAANYIKKLPFVENFKDSLEIKLSLSNGGIYTQQELKQSGGESSAKSIDFIWTMGGKTFYAYHKYTKESGGSQDNQYKDIQNFIEDANKSKKVEYYFIAIADGAYYEIRDSSTGKSKLASLKDRANNKKGVYALSIDELASFLQKLRNL